MPKGSLGDLWGSGLTWSDLQRNRLVSTSSQVGSLIVAFLFLPFTIIIKGSVKEPNKFHNYEAEKNIRKATRQNRPISSCLVLSATEFYSEIADFVTW